MDDHMKAYKTSHPKKYIFEDLDLWGIQENIVLNSKKVVLVDTVRKLSQQQQIGKRSTVLL